MKRTGVLIISPFFSPNIGGVETHLDDLVKELDNSGYNVFVQTYSPLTTKSNWLPREKHGHITIFRHRWIGANLFHKLEKYPILDFLYLTPYLCCCSFFWLLSNHKKIKVINSHGFNGAFIGNILNFFFHKKHLTSTHALYDNSPNSLTAKITSFVLNQTNIVLAQSIHSKDQLISWGVKPTKIKIYRYWVDPNKFNNKSKTRPEKFSVLFVSRLIPKKGTKIIVQLAKKLPKVKFNVIGSGPESEFIARQKNSNLNFIGKIDNSKLINYYSNNTLFIQPALYQEGFTRTIMEAVACGLPVVASDIGTIPEIVDSSVSVLVKPSVKNFQNTIQKIFQNQQLLHRLELNCPKYTKKYFSPKNIKLITKHF